MCKVYLKILILSFLIFSSAFSYAQDEEELIAYSRLTDGFWQIWIVDLNKGESEQLTTSSVDKRYPIWIEGGKKIMYRTNNAEIFIFDLKDKREVRILDKFGVITDPAWSEVNRRLAFTRYEGNLKDESEIWSVQLDGKDQKILTNEEGMQYNPAWSPDGTTIIYTSGKTFGTHEIWIMDKEGKNSRKLTENIGKYDILPVFSPGREKIAFASNRSDDFDIWIIDNDGESLKNLTKTKSLDTKPSFSPDGKKIVFTSARSGSLQIWVMDTNGENPKQITDGRSECQDASWIKIRKEEETQ